MQSARNKALAALGACLMLSGCADYMANRDSVTLGVGNAAQANIGIHTENPFPANANNTNIDADGNVVNKAMRRYKGAPTTAPAPAPAG